MGVFKPFPQMMFMAFRPATSSAQPPQLTKEIATYPKTLPQNPHPLIQGKTDTHWFLNRHSSSVHTMKVKFMMQSIFECNLCITTTLHNNFYKNVGSIRPQVGLLGHRRQMQYQRHHRAFAAVEFPEEIKVWSTGTCYWKFCRVDNTESNAHSFSLLITMS